MELDDQQMCSTSTLSTHSASTIRTNGFQSWCQSCVDDKRLISPETRGKACLLSSDVPREEVTKRSVRLVNSDDGSVSLSWHGDADPVSPPSLHLGGSGAVATVTPP